MINFKFLTEKQTFGGNQLDILKIYGTRCAITDFAILLGGDVSLDFYTSEGNLRENRTCCWWARTFSKENEPYIIGNNPYIVGDDGAKYFGDIYDRSIGARPAFIYSSLYMIFSNIIKGKNGIFEVEYGEYPQNVVTCDYAIILEKEYLNKTINLTGKYYTTDSVSCQDCNIPFQARTHTEYEFNEKKYI